ncbi:MAG TPA: class I SAM-dependent methyltransferase [Gemmataceae bacterium]|nr:class I SAM-dependent methyltransferase [Gemmataceae bacterium]
MDTPGEARDYDAMDHAAVNRAFVADFVEHWRGETPILDLGTGTALIPIEFYKNASKSTRVVGVDLAAAMLDAGRRNVAAAGAERMIELRQADAKALPFKDREFGAVMSNSIVHHIPDPRPVLQEAVRVTRPGGLLFFRDLMRPPDDATLNRLVDLYAAGANDHQRKLFADSLHAALTVDEAHALVADLGCEPPIVRATSDRHWTWVARKPAESRT